MTANYKWSDLLCVDLFSINFNKFHLQKYFTSFTKTCRKKDWLKIKTTLGESYNHHAGVRNIYSKQLIIFIFVFQTTYLKQIKRGKQCRGEPLLLAEEKVPPKSRMYKEIWLYGEQCLKALFHQIRTKMKINQFVYV